MTNLRSLGVTEEQERLFHRVKSAISNVPQIEEILENRPEVIYIACKKSGKFTNEELDFLESVFRPSMQTVMYRTLLSKIKQFFSR